MTPWQSAYLTGTESSLDARGKQIEADKKQVQEDRAVRQIITACPPCAPVGMSYLPWALAAPHAARCRGRGDDESAMTTVTGPARRR